MTRKYKKRIWIDLDNSPHVPFFYPIIRELNNRGYETILTARDCFQTCGLADMYGFNYQKVGRHYGKNKFLKVVGTLYRAVQLISEIRDHEIDLAASHGSRAQLIACWLLKIPDIVVYDYEYAKGLGFIHPTWKMAPEIISRNLKDKQHNLLSYPGIKEDVYVPFHKPDSIVLSQLGLKREDFIVTIRPPATEAHYHNPESELLFKAVIDYLGSQEHIEPRMVILPRNETKQTKYIKETWKQWYDSGKIIIPEHVVNGLDLMWYSDLVISGGGTMNREAAALGVPVYSIFRGEIGAVDKYLSKNGRLTLLKTVNDIQEKIVLRKRDKSKKTKSLSRCNALESIVSQFVNIIESSHRN